jgi:chromosome segregation ATPase
MAAEAITQLDKESEEVHKSMASQRQRMGGVNAALINSQAIDKQIRVLENRLDQALVKYNRALATNKRLRATIDNLRRERLVFDTVYTKFEKELSDQKKAMAEIIESSNSAYEAR